MTGILPEFNGVVLMSKEESSKFSRYGYWINLKGVWRWVKDFSGHMNRVSDDNDLGNVIIIWGLVDTTPHDKKFSFGAGDVDHMMNSLGDGVIMDIHMWYLSRSLMMDFILFFLFILFYFTFLFLFIFLFLEQLGLGFISHAVTNWWRSHQTDHETWENEVEGSGTKWHHTAWTPHAGLMLYSWSFRVGCTVVSTDHGL